MSVYNKLVIAAAGSGKTTYLVKMALEIKSEQVLITTYTESNEAEIRQKFFDLAGCVPTNVVIMTWFSFLITHGVKPFQGGLFDYSVSGMLLVSSKSGKRYTASNGYPVYYGESDFKEFYFDSNNKIYSDKLPKLVTRCNEKSCGAVIERISRIFQHVFIDEVQDLAGYDLDILVAFARSKVRLLMVGDPRQVTYVTHHEARYKKYVDGGIVNFLKNELPKAVSVEIDEATLNVSHRNNAAICELSSQLYPDLPVCEACQCENCRDNTFEHTGIYIVRKVDYPAYLAAIKPMQLREKTTSIGVNCQWPAMNFGESKGRGFDHVAILPTQPMQHWITNTNQYLKPTSRARLYVALTRARHSVAIVMDWTKTNLPNGVSLFRPSAD